MKKNILTHAFCFVLMVFLLVPTASATDLANISVQPRYTHVRNFCADLYISGDGCAQCGGEVELRDSSYSANLTVELQRSSNGRSWSTIKDWTTSDTRFASLDKEWYVSSGYKYRVYATVEVSAPDGTVVETVPAYSPTSEY